MRFLSFFAPSFVVCAALGQVVDYRELRPEPSNGGLLSRACGIATDVFVADRPIPERPSELRQTCLRVMDFLAVVRERARQGLILCYSEFPESISDPIPLRLTLMPDGRIEGTAFSHYAGDEGAELRQCVEELFRSLRVVRRDRFSEVTLHGQLLPPRVPAHR